MAYQVKGQQASLAQGAQQAQTFTMRLDEEMAERQAREASRLQRQMLQQMAIEREVRSQSCMSDTRKKKIGDCTLGNAQVRNK